MTSNADRVMIFDTTLRDGEQSPGCSMTQPEKLRVAKALAELGVDVIEAGFPAASRGDWESVNAVAREVQGPIICGLARCDREDIAKVASAVAPAANRRIHVFLATSAIHREFKLNMAKDEIIRRAVEGVKIAREYCEDIEFSPEDASRTELEFLAQVVEAVIDAGATTVNIPDTVGYTVPHEFAELFRYLRKNVPNIERARLSVHCHDDLGMAVANSLMAVVAGARQIECTINGIGERAGNCSLEEVVMAMRTRETFFNARTQINSQRLYPVSRLVSSITGMPIPRNKAVVGENAFAHESGIHQHGMLKHASTYEIMRPQDVGLSRSSLVLGKHSGRHALRERIKELGFVLEDAEFERVFNEFKALADKRKNCSMATSRHSYYAPRAATPGRGRSCHCKRALPSTGGARRRLRCRTSMARAPNAVPRVMGRSMRRSRPSKKSRDCAPRCKNSSCAASPRAKTPRAKPWCTSTTRTAATAAQASPPTSSSRRRALFSK